MIDPRSVSRSILHLYLDRSSICMSIDKQSLSQSILNLYLDRFSICITIDTPSVPRSIFDLYLNRLSIYFTNDSQFLPRSYLIFCLKRSCISVLIVASIDPSKYPLKYESIKIKVLNINSFLHLLTIDLQSFPDDLRSHQLIVYALR